MSLETALSTLISALSSRDLQVENLLQQCGGEMQQVCEKMLCDLGRRERGPDDIVSCNEFIIYQFLLSLTPEYRQYIQDTFLPVIFLLQRIEGRICRARTRGQTKPTSASSQNMLNYTAFSKTSQPPKVGDYKRVGRFSRASVSSLVSLSIAADLDQYEYAPVEIKMLDDFYGTVLHPIKRFLVQSGRYKRNCEFVGKRDRQITKRLKIVQMLCEILRRIRHQHRVRTHPVRPSRPQHA